MTDRERTFIPGGPLGRKTPRMRAGGVGELAALDRLRGVGRSVGLTEAHVEQTVTQFLELDGWRAIRTDPVSDRARGKGFGELGMPDHLYVRYGMPITRRNFSGHPPEIQSGGQVLWVEFKRPGRKPTPHQLAWHEAERARGALVLVIDDINFFFAWYKRSGLARRV
ncbi:MAG: hypothetical protein ACLPWF_27065 [Bryobacteraceae bacterium]|jgi:hypothetical protein